MPSEIFEFGDFKLDCNNFELSRAGRSVKLERKPMELLILLVTRKGSLVAGAKSPLVYGNPASLWTLTKGSTQLFGKFAMCFETIPDDRASYRLFQARATASFPT